MDLGACVNLTFLVVAAALVLVHVRAQDREQRQELEDIRREQRRLADEQRQMKVDVERTATESASAAIKADAAVFTAQRAEEKSLASRPVLVVVEPGEGPAGSPKFVVDVAEREGKPNGVA